MAVITPNRVTPGGILPASNSASNTDTIANANGRTVIRINNASGASITATISPNAAYSTRPGDGIYPSQSAPTKVITVPALASQIFGPVEKVYNDPTTGVFGIAWSATASVTYEAYEVTA